MKWMVLPAVALAGCGSTKAVEAPAGKPLPAVAYGTTAPPTTERLLTPSVQARPGRGDSLLRRSEERQSDEFDLPPH
ncbi:argininosuccinate lyase [Sphingomonas sp. Leaf412]|uniref:hypothetical protein n=1 Tax=Sphingomonas sp. Leaf412 TaxID=1736370 RepID=UPI0006FA5B26|nr:hypothetical protein [Sphingomonas sp. Leaf412]KQT34904.1 argininosuccinate lyase [Sphingomonas sp. Leaf412]